MKSLKELLSMRQNRYFLKTLPQRQGQYFYLNSILTAERGTTVLFQYMKYIIGEAIFLYSEKFPIPQKDSKDALYFDVSSIKTFTPLGSDIVKKVWSEFNQFNQSKQKLKANKYVHFTAYYKNLLTPVI